MTPKVHMMLHYPSLILQFGPLRQLWCMRFEGKHAYFKRIAHTMCNFKNPCLSLSLRHQMFVCWHLRSDGYAGESSVSHSSVKTVRFGMVPPDLQAALNDRLMSILQWRQRSDDLLQQVNKLSSSTVHYSVGDFFVIDISDGENVPVFMKILHVFCFRGLWYICGLKYVCKSYVYHKHAYLIENLKQWHVMVPGQEQDHHALDAYSDDEDNLYITLQYGIESVG